MIYLSSRGYIGAFCTGSNWIELGKLLKLSDIDSLHSPNVNLDDLNTAIKNSIRGLNLVSGNFMVCDIHRTNIVVYPNRYAAWRGAGISTPIICHFESDSEVIDAWQYNRTEDIDTIMHLCNPYEMCAIPVGSHADQWACFLKDDVENGGYLSKGNWILAHHNGDQKPKIEIMTDDAFQLKYSQVGSRFQRFSTYTDIYDMFTPGYPRIRKPQSHSQAGVFHKLSDAEIDEFLAEFTSGSPNADPIFSVPIHCLEEISTITGGFAPGYLYSFGLQKLSLLGQYAKIVESKIKYAAFQYNSPEVVDAIKVIYPMLNFVEDVYYRDWPTLTILMGTLPAGSIKRDEWIIFEPSTPGNPKFKIVSNEEYLKQYRVSK